MTEDTIKKLCYTKEEVDSMVAAALAEARAIAAVTTPNQGLS